MGKFPAPVLSSAAGASDGARLTPARRAMPLAGNNAGGSLLAARLFGTRMGVRRAKAQERIQKGLMAVGKGIYAGEPHSGGPGRESRKDRLFLSLRIPYFPHFTQRTPTFSTEPAEFPTISYLRNSRPLSRLNLSRVAAWCGCSQARLFGAFANGRGTGRKRWRRGACRPRAACPIRWPSACRRRRARPSRCRERCNTLDFMRPRRLVQVGRPTHTPEPCAGVCLC